MELIDAINKAKLNDDKAFNFLYNHFWERVFRFHYDRFQNEDEAEDIAIRAFAKAFEKIQTYDETKSSFLTWVINISKNAQIDLYRKREKTKKQLQDAFPVEIFQVPDNDPTPEDNLIREQNLSNLLADIKKLKPQYQKIIHLRYFEEHSILEISESLNEPVNNIKVKLFRARKTLAEIINSH